ncbi:MAG: hypothetical protein WC319_06410 [Candidatus Paceibacterota bacterium]|jgi:hypothetical protein
MREGFPKRSLTGYRSQKEGRKNTFKGELCPYRKEPQRNRDYEDQNSKRKSFPKGVILLTGRNDTKECP